MQRALVHLDSTGRPESRPTQQCPLKVSPTLTNYSPDGKSLLYTSSGHQMFFMTYGKELDIERDSWHHSEKDGVRSQSLQLTERVSFSFTQGHRINSHVQSRWRRHHTHILFWPHPTDYGLSKSADSRESSGSRGRLCCGRSRSPRQASNGTMSHLSDLTIK